LARIALLLGGIAGLLMTLAPWQAHSRSAASNCDAAEPSIDAEEASFVDVLNRYRAENGREPVTLDPVLDRVGAWMARDMAHYSRVAHVDSLGRDPLRRMAECGFPFAPAGEDLAAGHCAIRAALRSNCFAVPRRTTRSCLTPSSGGWALPGSTSRIPPIPGTGPWSSGQPQPSQLQRLSRFSRTPLR